MGAIATRTLGGTIGAEVLAAYDALSGQEQERYAGLEQRATTPDRVLRHTWSVGDMVMWDNRGLVHRACPFDRSKPRRMHRTTLAGDEPIR